MSRTYESNEASEVMRNLVAQLEAELAVAQRKARAFDWMAENSKRVMHWQKVGYRFAGHGFSWYETVLEAVEAEMKAEERKP